MGAGVVVATHDHDPVAASGSRTRLGLSQKRAGMAPAPVTCVGHDVLDERIWCALAGHVGNDDQGECGNSFAAIIGQKNARSRER